MKIDSSKNDITLELHYGFTNDAIHSINFHIKTTCALVQAELTAYLIRSLYPEEDFEILALPSSEGSFKDNTVIKFLNDNQGVILTIGTTIGTLLAILLFKSQFRVNQTTSDINSLEIIDKCKALNLSDEQIEKVEQICNSYYPKKQKNIFYQSIMSDANIIELKPTIFEKNESIFQTVIKKTEFKDFIEEIPKEREFLKVNLSGNIQLSQPFIDKQQQYGRGVAWKGVYYGTDVFDEKDQLIIKDGENIFFYMQDDEYKNQILNQQISFTSGDNIGVIFDVSRYYDYVNNRFGKPMLYVKKVSSHNDNLVQHKKDLQHKKDQEKFDKKHKHQNSLFNDSQE